MQPYRHFAEHYHLGPYIHFTHWVSEEVFPHLLEVLNFSPVTLLDLACGSGVFANHMAAQGISVTGLDASSDMLQIAQTAAQKQKLSVQWLQQDMSKLDLPKRLDCITCFFDSLNYLLQFQDLAHTFQAVYRHLNPGGYFIFDMNTIYGLAVTWQRFPYNIPQDLPDYLEVTENTYDYENSIAQMRIIMFERVGKTWIRYEEIHQERGYAVDDITLILQQTGFELTYLVGSPILLTPLSSTDSRMWVVAHKSE